MMNEWEKVKGLDWAAAAVPTIGSKPAVWASSHNLSSRARQRRIPTSSAASRAFIAFISGTLDRVGEVRAGPGPQQRAGDHRSSPSSTSSRRSPSSCPTSVFPPTVPGIGDVTTPTYELAVNQVVLGKEQPKEALDSAAEKANALLEDNRQKYGA